MDREVVHVSVVIATCLAGPPVVSVATTHRETNCAAAQSSSLTLNTCEAHSIVDHEVVPSVIAEWDQHSEARVAQGEHGGERCAITDVLGMIHAVTMPAASAGP